MASKKDDISMANQVYQSGLDGSKSVSDIQLDKEVVESSKTLYYGDYYQVSITEKDQDKLDIIHMAEGSKEETEQSVRQFLAKKMRVTKGKVLPLNDEGLVYQKDLDKFAKVL